AQRQVLRRRIEKDATDVIAADVDRHQIARAKRGIGGEKGLHLLRQVRWRRNSRGSYLGLGVAELGVGGRAAHRHIGYEAFLDAEMFCKWQRINAPKIQRQSWWCQRT